MAPFPSFTKIWHNTSYSTINPSRPELSAKGKSILITGGGSGIGAKAAYSFAEASASIIGIVGRTEKTLIETKKYIEETFPEVKVVALVADVTKKDEVDTAFATFVAQAGKLHVLINNAGYGDRDPFIKDAQPDDWMHSIEVNLKGSLIVASTFVHAAVPDAVVINVTSFISYLPLANYSSYAVSKAASAVLFDCLQLENPGLRVVNVHPGIVDSEMNRKSGVVAQDDGVFSSLISIDIHYLC